MVFKIRTREDLPKYVANATFNGWTYKHPSWDAKLWEQPYDKIISSLLYRFKHTQDRTEYYGIMPYLVKEIPDDLLYILYDDRYAPTEFDAELQRLNSKSSVIKYKTKSSNYIYTNDLRAIEGIY
jgi:hypothetical protein